MERKSEQIKVGAMIVVVALLFLVALIFVGGANLFHKKKATYLAYFKFAGGLEPGSYVRFGGLKVGTVKSAEIDSQDSTRIRVRIEVAKGTPIRTDSRARISSLGLLGENYLEVSSGTRGAPLAREGSEIPSAEMAQLADVINNINTVSTQAIRLMGDIDHGFLELAGNASQLIDNIKSIVGPENRRHIDSALANVDVMLAENRAALRRTFANFEAASDKLGPALDQANATMARANTLIDNFNTLAVENRTAIHAALLSLRDSLADARQVMGDLDDTLAGNRDNIDETLENLRTTSQNLKQFTETIKQRPFSLIRIKTERDRVPPTGR